MFHRHKYIEVERFYTPGMQGEFEGRISARSLKRMMEGTTTIWFECKICPKQMFKEIQGKSTKNVTANE